MYIIYSKDRSELKTSFLSKTQNRTFIEDKILRHFAFDHTLLGSLTAELQTVFGEKNESRKG